MRTRSCLLRRALLAAGLLGCALASAQPAGTPVRLLVGYAAGGPVDAAARQLAPVLARELGQPVVVENKAGANGTLAGDLVAKAAPDGHTLWFAASPPLTISPHVMKRMPFDPARDLTPVAPLVSYYNALVVNKDLPVKDLGELIAYAKAHPGKLAYGSAGVGGSNHLSGELFAARSRIQLTHVPYKGNAPAMTDVIGGQLAMMFDIVSTARTYIASGRVRALAVTSPQRNPSLPEVPTMAEAGLPGFEVGGWYGVFGPARLPPAVVTRLGEAISRALASAELRQAWLDQGYELWAGSPDALGQRASRDREMWGTVAKGIQVD